MSETAGRLPAHPLADRHAAGTAFLGMVIFMASWAMLFASLFFAYGIVRQGAPAWPPPDLPHPPLALPLLATLALGAASLWLEQALQAARGGRPTRVPSRLLGAALAGAVFLALQIRVWHSLWQAGLLPSTGTYASVFYTLTVFHGLHVLVGIGGLAWVGARSTSADKARGPAVPIRLWSLYWHMIAIVWLCIFLMLYVF